jgi:hypothetical protein
MLTTIFSYLRYITWYIATTILYHFNQFVRHHDTWRTWRKYGFGNLPILPWHVRNFQQVGAAGDEKIPYSANNCQMNSSLRQNDCDNHDISLILEGPWRVTDELIKMVQYTTYCTLLPQPRPVFSFTFLYFYISSLLLLQQRLTTAKYLHYPTPRCSRAEIHPDDNSNPNDPVTLYATALLGKFLSSLFN